MNTVKENKMSQEDYLLLSMTDESKERKIRGVNLKGLIIVSEVGGGYHTYECKVLVPSLRVKVEDDILEKLVKHKEKHKNQKEYMNVLFMVLGNPVRSKSLYKR